MPKHILILIKQHPGFFIVIAFAAVLFLSDVWFYKEFARAESYFALGSRLMIEQGDWITPHAPDERPLNKPPLTYWLIGVFYKLFGTNYGSARLPSALAALLVLAIVYWLSVRANEEGDRRVGLVAVAMLAASFLFLSFARMAMSDMLLTLSVTASLACFIVALSDRPPAGKSFVLLGYVALAVGVLAKGPVAVVLVVLPIGLELALRRNRADLKKLRLLLGLALFGVFTAPYFLAVYARAGAAPLRFFFFGENLQRFTGQIYGESGRPVWFEPAAFFSDLAPWSIFIFAALWFNWRERGQPSAASRLVHLWLGAAVVLFSLSRFKLDYYLLPAMPAGALIIAPLIANSEKLPRVTQLLVKALLGLCALMIVTVALLSLKAAAVLEVSTWLRFLPVVVALTGLAAAVVFLVRRTAWQSMLMIAATICLTFLAMEWVLLPAFVNYLPATRIAAGVPASSVVYTSRAASDWANDIAFNLPEPHKVERTNDGDGHEILAAVLKNDPKAVAIIRESEYASLLMKYPSLKVLAQAETFGHGGLSVEMALNPRRERLLLVGHDY